MEQIEALVGSVRRFGPAGPPYEVIGAAATPPGAEPLVRIHLIESNEDVDYPLRDLLDDPRDA